MNLHSFFLRLMFLYTEVSIQCITIEVHFGQIGNRTIWFIIIQCLLLYLFVDVESKLLIEKKQTKKNKKGKQNKIVRIYYWNLNKIFHWLSAIIFESKTFIQFKKKIHCFVIVKFLFFKIKLESSIWTFFNVFTMFWYLFIYVNRVWLVKIWKKKSFYDMKCILWKCI